MTNINIFFIIIIIFLIFIFCQIYFYSDIYKKNDGYIKKIESFQSTLIDIENGNGKNYILNDSSMEKLLDDYNNLKLNKIN